MVHGRAKWAVHFWTKDIKSSLFSSQFNQSAPQGAVTWNEIDWIDSECFDLMS